MPENSHHYNVSTLFLKFLKLLIVSCIFSKPDPDSDSGPEKKTDPPKKGPLGKTGLQETKNVVILLE